MTHVELTSSHNRRSERYLKRAEKKGNFLLADTLRFDTEIEDLQHAIATVYDEEGFDFAPFDAKIAELEANIEISLKNVDAIWMAGWNDYFRLVNHQHFARQRVLAPFIFSDHRRYKERQELVDGAYGINASILNTAVNLYDDNYHSPEQQSELLGVINEETDKALKNRAGVPSKLALSSSTIDDHFYKSDVDFWELNKRDVSLTRFQVKSSYPSLTTYLKNMASSVVYVYAKDFDNMPTPDTTFPTSRRIIAEVQGTISDEDKYLLDTTHRKYMQHIQSVTQQ